MKRMMSIAAIALFVVGSSALACETCGCTAKKAEGEKTACCAAEKKCASCTADKVCAGCTAKKAAAEKAKAK